MITQLLRWETGEESWLESEDFAGGGTCAWGTFLSFSLLLNESSSMEGKLSYLTFNLNFYRRECQLFNYNDIVNSHMHAILNLNYMLALIRVFVELIAYSLSISVADVCRHLKLMWYVTNFYVRAASKEGRGMKIMSEENVRNHPKLGNGKTFLINSPWSLSRELFFACLRLSHSFLFFFSAKNLC
jgi:hypothetical protein